MVVFEPTRAKEYLGRINGKEALQIGTVAFSFILFNQYWRVDEHVVFILILFATASGFFGSGLSKSLKIGSTGALYLFVGFLSWIVLSVIWSPTPHLSLSYSLLVVLAGATAVVQGFLYGLRVLIAGIVVGVSVIGLHVASGEVLNGATSLPFSGTGLYTNPSSLSFILGIGMIAAVFALTRNPATWVLVAGFGIIGSIWLWGLSILTAIFALLGAFSIGLALFHVRISPPQWNKVLGYGYASLVIFGGVLFWFFRGPIVRPFGEDASLGERLPLWAAYFEAVLWRPWLGSGWGSTVGWDFPLSQDDLTPVYEWFPAHNGYLDIALMLGFVGLFLFLGGLLSLYWESLNLAIARALSWRTAFVPVLLTYLMLNDVMATSFPKLIGVFLVGSMIGSTVRMRGDLPPSASLNRSLARVVLA